MARIRTIKPEFPQSESMGRVSRDARLCFILLWTLSDDAGRLRGNSRMLASLLYPYDDDAKKLMDKWLTELAKEGCITWYSHAGDTYIQINAWLMHQKIDKPSASKLPPFDDGSRSLARAREGSFTTAAKEVAEGKGREGNGMDSDAPEPDATPAVIFMPLIDNTEHPIKQQQVEEWQSAYPAVDVMQQLREMRSWSNSKPANRKTARGVNAFIVRWLGNEQDKGGRQLSVVGGYAAPSGRTVV